MIKKIEGPGSIRTTQPLKRTTKTDGSSGGSFVKHLDEATETNPSQAVSSPGFISGILGVQEVDDALAEASKGTLRAQDILDRLEDIRLELLTGSVSKERLLQLSHIITTRKSQIKDAKLVAILDEIDLRAQVELAKYLSN